MFATGAPGNCRGKDFFPKLINADPDQWRWWKARNSFWDTRSFSAYRKSHKYLFGLKCKLKTLIWLVLRASLFPHNSRSQKKKQELVWGGGQSMLDWTKCLQPASLSSSEICFLIWRARLSILASHIPTCGPVGFTPLDHKTSEQVVQDFPVHAKPCAILKC